MIFDPERGHVFSATFYFIEAAIHFPSITSVLVSLPQETCLWSHQSDTRVLRFYKFLMQAELNVEKQVSVFVKPIKGNGPVWLNFITGLPVAHSLNPIAKIWSSCSAIILLGFQNPTRVGLVGWRSHKRETTTCAMVARSSPKFQAQSLNGWWATKDFNLSTLSWDTREARFASWSRCFLLSVAFVTNLDT